MNAAPSQPEDARLALVVMGVSGSGKTTIGERLAAAFNVEFIDGDALHSPEARAKMASGKPLDDNDRWPWLDRIGDALGDRAVHPRGLIVACSALKRVYRERLRNRVGGALRFLYLKGGKELMRERVGGRKGHYMPASLVDSQFAALEEPAGEADVITIAADADLASEVAEAIRQVTHR
ncbi:MAG TPA: gluconokinase [Roseiarcus sp.]|nr:gluconokinase [Roseiarcus sp.]